MHSEKRTTLIVTGLAALLVALGLFCTYERDNPLDPGSDVYAGDAIARDDISPTLIVTAPQSAVSSSDYDSVVVRGAAFDAQSGLKNVTVNGFAVIIDSTSSQSSVTYTYWHAAVYLSADTTVITITATDNAARINTTSLTRTVARILFPAAATGVTVELVATRLRVTWSDESRNEEGFIIQRKIGGGTFEDFVNVGPDETSFTDSVTVYAPTTAYYYRVIAYNSSGQSAPSAQNVYVYPSATISDTTGPGIAFVSPRAGDTINTLSADIVITVTDPSGVQASSVKVNNIPAMQSGGQWVCQVALAPGAMNTLTATAQDNSANSNLATVSINVFCDTSVADTRGPVLAFVQPQHDDTVASDRIDVIVTATDNAGVAWVHLNGGAMSDNGSGSYVVNSVALVPGPNVLEVAAEDALGNMSQLSVTVHYDSIAVDNTPPLLTVDYPPNNARLSQSPVLVQGTASDASGITAVTVNGINADISGSSWSISRPLGHGSNELTVTAYDGSSSSNQTQRFVTALFNRAPWFDVKPDTAYTIGSGSYGTIAHANDPDTDGVALQLVFPTLGGITFTDIGDGTGIISGFQPTTPGTVSFMVRATDDYGDTASVSWNVTVSQPGNTAPYFTIKPPNRTVFVNSQYRDTLIAADNQSGTVAISLVKPPTPVSAAFNAPAVNWTPTKNDTGVHTFTVRATDVGGLTTDHSWLVTVQRGNNKPVATPLASMFTIERGDIVDFTVSVYDPDGDSVIHVTPVTTSPSFSGFSFTAEPSNVWRFRMTQTSTMAGNYLVRMIFRDNYFPFLRDTAEVTVTVNSPNRAPVISMSPLPPNQATIGAPYTASIGVSDQDGDSLTVTLAGAPSALKAVLSSPTGGQINLSGWTPSSINPSSYFVTLIVTDAAGGRDSLAWGIGIVDTGLGYLSDFRVASVPTGVQAAHIDRSNVIWVGTRANGMYYSDDLGSVFKPITSGAFGSVQSIGSMREYSTGNVVVAGVMSGTNNSGTSVLMNTTNKGASWTQASSVIDSPFTSIVSENLRGIACAPRLARVVLTALATGQFESISGNNLPLTGAYISELMLDTIVNYCYAILRNKEIYRKDLDSTTMNWSLVGSLPATVTSAAFVEARKFLAGTIQGLYMSTSSDASAWNAVTTLPAVRVVDVLCVRATGDVFVSFDGGTYSSGLFVLKSGTSQWRYVGGSKYMSPGYLCASPSGDVFLATRTGKVYRYIAP